MNHNVAAIAAIHRTSPNAESLICSPIINDAIVVTTLPAPTKIITIARALLFQPHCRATVTDMYSEKNVMTIFCANTANVVLPKLER
jgi:hypothetical protein